MKKDEFFAQLRTAFAGMDEELIMDILGDYENHFKEGMENGKSEEEICDELGNVEEIRQAFLDENPAAMTINVNSFVSNDSGAANKQSDSNIVFPINRVTDTNNTDDANFNSNSDTVGNSDIYNRFYPGIQRVNAQLTDADIEIKKSSTNDVELSVTGGLADDIEALKETLRVSASAGTLSIQQEKKAGISVSYAASRLFGLKVGKYSAGIVIHVAVPEQLVPAFKEITEAYQTICHSSKFVTELRRIRREFQGRPTPVYHCERLSNLLGHTQIYLKREDLNHTGAHKLNHCMGEGLLAKFMGKKKLIAETGAGQHGVALATAAAYFGLECDIYMGEVDIKKQAPNVSRMRLLGARVIPATHGLKTLKEAVDAAFEIARNDGMEQVMVKTIFIEEYVQTILYHLYANTSSNLNS
mgnify:CR=1 FL=1